MNRTICHLTVGGAPYCTCTGSLAGLQTALRLNVMVCEYPSRRQAEAAARKLRSHYFDVRVVPGICDSD